jgi:thiamine-monophosphate kinase
MDVSDGLLIDADRLARANGVGINIAIETVPLSPAAVARDGERLALAAAGDDYELLFTAPAGAADAILAAAVAARTSVTRIGQVVTGGGVRAFQGGSDVTPARLGWEH